VEQEDDEAVSLGTSVVESQDAVPPSAVRSRSVPVQPLQRKRKQLALNDTLLQMEQRKLERLDRLDQKREERLERFKQMKEECLQRKDDQKEARLKAKVEADMRLKMEELACRKLEAQNSNYHCSLN